MIRIVINKMYFYTLIFHYVYMFVKYFHMKVLLIIKYIINAIYDKIHILNNDKYETYTYFYITDDSDC